MDRSSSKVNRFFYNVRKLVTLYEMSDTQMFAMAEYHMQENAARRMMRPELEKAQSTAMDELLASITTYFVENGEAAKAKIRLMSLQMQQSMEAHILVFQDLVEISGTT